MLKGQWQAARALIGWSQSDLAEKVGVHSLTIKRLEGGQAVSDDLRARAHAALEAAGVEFTNGEQPGVRLRKSAISSLQPLTFVSTSQLSVRFRSFDGEFPVLVHVERKAIDDHFRLSKSTAEQRKSIAEANLETITEIAKRRHAARMWSEGTSSGSRFRQIVIREEDFRH